MQIAMHPLCADDAWARIVYQLALGRPAAASCGVWVILQRCYLFCLAQLLYCTQAFATPSFAASAFASDGLSPEASPQPAREVHVRPHALDHQVPGLLGPLPVSTCDDSAAEESDGDADWEDPACSLLVLG